MARQFLAAPPQLTKTALHHDSNTHCIEAADCYSIFLVREGPGFSQPAPRTLKRVPEFSSDFNESEVLSLSQRFIVVLGICIEFVRFKRRMTKGCRMRPGCLLANFSSLPAHTMSRRQRSRDLNLLPCLPGRCTPTNTRIKLGSIGNGFLPRPKGFNSLFSTFPSIGSINSEFAVEWRGEENQ